MIHELVVPKGTPVVPHIQASNNNKELLGEDANEWKPERWLAQLHAALEDAHRPSVHSNLYVPRHSEWPELVHWY